MEQQSGGNRVLIRPAAPAERRACRMLLPQAAGVAQRCQWYVALDGSEQRVVGAAALGLDARVEELNRRWQTDLRVIVPFRGRGIGRALLDHVVEQAVRHGISALHTWEWVEPDREAAQAWAAYGFAPCQRRMEYEADLARAYATLLPFYERAREEDWIPTAARIIPLADADIDAVAELHTRCLGGTRRLLMPLLRGAAADAFDPQYSRVLLLNEQVVGFTLGRIHPGGVCEIDSNVIHPSVRLGWANLWLKFEAAAVLLAGGIHTIRYFSLQQHTDTQRVSRQVGGRLLRTVVQMRRELAPASLNRSSPPAAATGAGG